MGASSQSGVRVSAVSKYLLATPQTVGLFPYVILLLCELSYTKVILVVDDINHRWHGCLPL
jgi:hypothetical protein